ncbi:MAG: hypothetical protein QOE68_4337 [Thermoanaerobaculia bacterium]|nr:hypothetical protein [Thermoanaerobaculia bacterium]
MRLPIKLNPTFLSTRSRSIVRPLTASGDPSRIPELAAEFSAASEKRRTEIAAEFSAAVSALKFAATFKTTRPGRLAASTSLLESLLRGTGHVIADIGASDATTSADLAERLAPRYEKLVAMDLNDSVEVANDGRHVAFYAPDGKLLVVVTKRLVWYADTRSADFVSKWTVARMFGRVDPNRERRTVPLINPRFVALSESNPAVSFQRHDLFVPLPFRATCVRIANLLNLGYFSPAEIERGLAAATMNLAEDGLLLVTRNDDLVTENGTIFVRTARRLKAVATVGAGSEIAGIAEGLSIPE